MIEILLAIALSTQSQQTVTVTPAPNAPVIIMLKAEAEAKFKQLCIDGSDDKLLHALAAALNPMPNWPQLVMNGDASVCQRNPKPLPVVPVRVSWEDPR